MFTIGSVIFIAYMFGLLTMINRSHKEQEQEFKNLSNKADEMDMDGMGNFSRFQTDNVGWKSLDIVKFMVKN